VRFVHRLLALLLLLPLLAWTGTGLLFLVKPGWAAAYESLHAFDGRPLDPGSLVDPKDLLSAAGAASRWELGSTALGPVFRVSGGAGGGPSLVHGATGRVISPLDREAVEAVALDAASRASGPTRYGAIEEVILGEKEGVVRFNGGAVVRVNRYDLTMTQRGSDTEWIDRLYDVHYLRWTGSERLDRILAPLAILGVWLLAFTGLRMLVRRSRPRRPAREESPPTRGRRREVRRGDIHWIAPEHGGGSLAHPHVVLQDDLFNSSRVPTVILCALTSKLRRADEPGNVLLDEGEGNLPKRSVAVVSQLITVEKANLGRRVGSLSEARVDEILAGLRFQQRSYFRRSS